MERRMIDMSKTLADQLHPAPEHGSARRQFLLQALGLSAAGLAAGGGAAWTRTQTEGAAAARAALADVNLQLDAAATAKAALELSFSTLQAQSAELQSRLATSLTQNAQLASSLSSAQQEAVDVKSQLASAQSELGAAQEQLGKYRLLIGLYDQLDGVSLDGMVRTGLDAMAAMLAGLLAPATLLRDGLALARNLLVSFEAVLPDFEAAMAWLGEQVVRLKVNLWSVETNAQQTINSGLAGVAAVFGGFAGFVLDHLPFNVGAKVRATLASVQSALAGLADLTDGAADQVLLKISKHVDNGPQSWKQRLVTPLRETTLAPADQVLSTIGEARATFTTALDDPARAALDERQALREQIAAFRTAHNI